MNRRFFLRGLVACPAVVAASSLMPIRGLILPVGWVPLGKQHAAWWDYNGLLRSAKSALMDSPYKNGFLVSPCGQILHWPCADGSIEIYRAVHKNVYASVLAKRNPPQNTII